MESMSSIDVPRVNFNSKLNGNSATNGNSKTNGHSISPGSSPSTNRFARQSNDDEASL